MFTIRYLYKIYPKLFNARLAVVKKMSRKLSKVYPRKNPKLINVSFSVRDREIEKDREKE